MLQVSGIRCEVGDQLHPLALLGCRELNYGQRSALPLHPFRLSVPEAALAGLLDEPFNSFIQTCREDDQQYEESDLPNSSRRATRTSRPCWRATGRCWPTCCSTS